METSSAQTRVKERLLASMSLGLNHHHVSLVCTRQASRAQVEVEINNANRYRNFCNQNVCAGLIIGLLALFILFDASLFNKFVFRSGKYSIFNKLVMILY